MFSFAQAQRLDDMRVAFILSKIDVSTKLKLENFTSKKYFRFKINTSGLIVVVGEPMQFTP